MDIKIAIVTHKKYWFPEDAIYYPIQVGFGDCLGILRDNTGENISKKNHSFCELTAMYWMYKNLNADFIGISHYRRHFASNKFSFDKRKRVIGKDELEFLLRRNDVLVPKPRNYFIETNYTQYIHAHYKKDLDMTRRIILEKFPEYIESFDIHMNETKSHLFNMFIMRKNIFDDYCKWLFSILFELEESIDISNYDNYNKRVFGFISERLLDVYFYKNNIKYKNIPYVFMERQNWFTKGYKFLKRKLLSKI